ncbi:MAG: hypothetical protein JWM11_3798 [Planctomycetaceae bacterium]|nr:hypothetical protein [Planctomycetaceae bacterium]
MDETPEMIRQQMEATKSHLTEKLESLEQQVSDTVQTTGTAVNATVEAVQETVESVAEAVQGAVHSVTNAFDVRRQIDKHPLLVLGGSAILGYLAGEILARQGRHRTVAQPSSTVPPPTPTLDTPVSGTGMPAIESAAIAAAIAAAYKSGWDHSLWHQLKGQAVGTLLGIVQEVASRAGPLVIDHFTNKRENVAPIHPEGTDSKPEPSAESECRP